MQLPDVVGSRSRFGAIVVSLLCLGLLVAACSSAPSLTADEVLAKAREAMAGVESFRFETEIQGELDTPGAQQTADSTGGPGEWAAPDRWHLARLLGAEVTEIGPDTYMRVLNGDAWQHWVREDEESTIGGAFQVPELMAAQLDDSDGETYVVVGLREQRLEDGGAVLIPYELAVNRRTLLPSTMTQWWASVEDLAELAECPGRDVSDGCARTVVTLFGYGDPVSIEPPERFTERVPR